MPSCPAIDCNNGFGGKPPPPGITFHRFPKDEERRKFWVQQLHRDDGFTATENSRICSAHFAPTDYKYDEMAQRRLLKDGAFPHIFSGRAKHLTKESPASRPPKATASSRLHAVNQRLQEQMEVFEQDDAVDTMEQIVEKLKVEHVPNGFVTLEQARELFDSLPHLYSAASVTPAIGEHNCGKRSQAVHCKKWQASQTQSIQSHRHWQFVSAVTNLWKIMNTRTRFHGEHKRDVYREPITSMDGPQIQFLHEFIVFLDQWKAMGQRSASLTNETFLAVRHTCEALIALSKYCLEELHMDFVMLGKFSQDFLEGRFGWLRQLSGAIYYLTMAQLLQNEKKIRAQTLISHSDVTREDLKCLAVPPATAELCKLAGEMAITISQLLDARGSDAEEEQDASTVQFVAGALVKVETEHRHCADCEAMLVQERKAEKPMVVEFEDEAMQNENINSLEAMTRGGLLVPTTVAFAICWKARNVFSCIKNDNELYSKLWKSDNSKALFAEIVMNLLEDDRDLMDIVVSGKLSCESGHESAKSIVIRFFNCCAKNLAKDTAPFKAAPRRKALKLTAQ